jgi:hypothetical protein
MRSIGFVAIDVPTVLGEQSPSILIGNALVWQLHII